MNIFKLFFRRKNKKIDSNKEVTQVNESDIVIKQAELEVKRRNIINDKLNKKIRNIIVTKRLLDKYISNMNEGYLCTYVYITDVFYYNCFISYVETSYNPPRACTSASTMPHNITEEDIKYFCFKYPNTSYLYSSRHSSYLIFPKERKNEVLLKYGIFAPKDD